MTNLTEDCLVLKCHFQILNIRDWSLEPLCRQPFEIMISRTMAIDILPLLGNLYKNKVGCRVDGCGVLDY